MDFPSSLHPTLFMTGPLGLSNVPDMSFMCSWRDALTLPENSQNGVPRLATGLLWEPETPGPLPLLPPGPDPWDPGVTAQDLLFRGGFSFRRKPQAVLDVTEQLSRFLWDHGDIAFAPLGKLMLENFKLEGSRSKKKTVVSVKRLLQDLGGHQPWGQVASEKGRSWGTNPGSPSQLFPLPHVLSLGFPQLPTAPILHPWGPCPGQVSGQPSGRAAA
uniref:TATA-box binding protein associated factor, RNA polymerase I subunit C n=1 Tax=Canis lupus familiaris TaxID=9615 RepID=A0A8I3RYZ5_CANLF